MGNEWIDFNQPYFKIPVAKEGVYRLNYSDLQAVGFPVGDDPKRFQLYHRGKEQAILVEGEGDLQFDPGDFIEFYGEQNDGTLDQQLYKQPSFQPHNYYNLYSDTTSYFLTVGAAEGKRMTVFYEDNTASLPAETFHTAERILLFNNEYAGGIDIANEVFNTFFDRGEGWTSGKIFQTQAYDYTLTDILKTVPAGGLPELETMIVGRGAMAHAVEIYVGASFRLWTTLTFGGYDPQKTTLPLQWSDIAADGTLKVRIKVNGVGGQPDRVSLSYIKLNFPAETDGSATEKTFRLTSNPGDKSYVQITSPPAGSRLFDVTDPNSTVRIDGSLATSLNAIVPSTSSPRKIYLSSTTMSPAIKRASFRQIIPAQHDYIIIGHPWLRKPALGYSDPIKAYADYRASAAGGSYDTLVVNINQLYDQFSYGETTPLAIFKFLKFLANSNLPKYLLLVGKGMDVYYKYHRNPSGFGGYKNLIPPAGYPASDMAYSVGLAGTTHEPAIPTGRIPAMTSEHVAAYLNKAKEMDALPFDDLWRKNVLHLSGGREEGEPELLQGYLKSLQGVAEDYHFGGKVSALAKYSKDIQLVNVSKQVNEGVNLITFFGHSSASNLDFDIGFATNPVMGYNNKGKYPTLLMNGCNVGSYFLQYVSIGEDWLLARDRGAGLFIAHSSYGFTHLLKRYSDFFYEVGYQDSTYIYKGIGDIQKETAKRYMADAPNVMENTSQVEQMVLIGDPAIKLFGAPKPDLETNDDNVSIHALDGQPITAMTEAFALKIIVRNFGQAKRDTVRIEVARTLNDNSVLLYDSLYPSTKYADTLTFLIKKGREKGFGNNSFRITIDQDDVIPEMTKENNVATKDFVIPLNGTKNLYPTNYGIVNTVQASVSFQTSDLLSAERDFILELDTINTFDSPFKQQFIVSGKVLARHSVQLLSADSMAYYWRTKLKDPTPEESLEWTQSTFTYINDGPEGWAQVHFPQYLENETVGLIHDESSRLFKFKETVTDIDIRTFGSNHAALNTDVSIKINNEEFNLTQQGFICRDNSINLVAFDKNSAAPYIGVKFKWYNRGNRACGREPWVINNYVPGDMAAGGGFDMIQYIDNIQEGDSVVLFNIGDAQYSAWPAAIRTKIGELGISAGQLDDLQPGEPIVIFGKKGSAPGTASIHHATSSPGDIQELVVNKTITGRYSSGWMNSGLIGPAANWQSFVSRYSQVEATDVLTFDVVGVNMKGEELIILENVSGDQDLTSIDANQFPYLKIIFKITDGFNLTPAQLDKWIVVYTPVAEGILLYNGPVQQQVLMEGQVWKGDYGFVNISNKTFSDSVTVSYDVFNQERHVTTNEQIKIKAPLPDDTTHFSLDVPTIGQGGLNDLKVFANPKILVEQYYDNNVLQLLDYIWVKEETIKPVLDVSIDGRYIENGDLVSSNPLILIKVVDENKYILKKDTVGMRVFLTYPCATEVCEPIRILLTDEKVKWFPATETEAFRIEFRPTNLVNGTYILQIEAQDARNNSSGNAPYEIQFTVESESALKISDPYPNPVKEQVYFKVVISGDILPASFELQLISVNGREVAYFGKEKFPSFHTGTNELVWNGTDKNGDVLPGGIYIYKIVSHLNGKQIEKIGKLVLLKGL
jgi:hypothetical protein